MVLFQVLDPQELRPRVDGSSLFIDLESGAQLEVSEDYVQGRYRERIDAHVGELRREAQRAGLGYHLLQTDQPLDQALTQYLQLRTGVTDGLAGTRFSLGGAHDRRAGVVASFETQYQPATTVQLTDVV